MPLFGKSKAPATTLFFATDVHGSERTWRKFINAGKFYNANVLVMGGDIIGKMAIPIIREKAGAFRATLQGRVEHFASEAELQGLLDRIEILGFYSKVMQEDEYLALQSDPNVDRWAVPRPGTRTPASPGCNWRRRRLRGRRNPLFHHGRQ